MFGRKPESPAAPAVTEPAFEAMAASLNQRGRPYIFQGTEFPPGVWVPITTAQSEQMAWFDAWSVRPKPETPAEVESEETPQTTEMPEVE
jgi:hypothetical protein